MGKSGLTRFLGLMLVLVPLSLAQAQGTAPAGARAADKANFDALKGTWVRPDGGYRIVIDGIAADGRIEAMYFNPNRLPFAKAQASREGTTLRAFFELQAGGYAGSTYELRYDPASDQLKGTYYQAVAKQKFEIYFMRK